MIFIEQEERTFSINAFRCGEADVLVATDVASKGLDFPNIRHVINYDMPKDIEDYVHRIGRTGRSGKTGLATTFVNDYCSEQILMDLKLLLKEAKQKVPTFLESLSIYEEMSKETQSSDALFDTLKECGFCGGLGHSLSNCTKVKIN